MEVRQAPLSILAQANANGPEKHPLMNEYLEQKSFARTVDAFRYLRASLGWNGLSVRETADC
jgi:hypothetical protein